MASGQNSVGFDVVTVTSTGQKTLEEGTNGIPNGARGLIMTIETNAVRIRYDNSTVAVSTGVDNGMILNNNDVFVLDSWTVPKSNWRQVMLSMRIIADVAGSTGDAVVHYFD